MTTEAIRSYVIEVIKRQETNVQEKINFFNKLFNNNLLDHPRLLKACINDYYDRQYKINNCISKDTVIDASIEFEVSTQSVHNVIYQYRDVRLDF